MRSPFAENLLFASRIVVCLAAAGTAFAAFSSNAMADAEPNYPARASMHRVVVPAHSQSFGFDTDRDGTAPFEARYIKAAMQMHTDADGGFVPSAVAPAMNRPASAPFAQNDDAQQVAGLSQYLHEHRDVENAPIRHEQS
ncbi:hypothetical protein [Robbsia sp. KACC 23696]|uniref:hypothetical protein n=1 Tax=Robbsia sp. KACC 23696 TaxID=3149231 RepID=UPI00325AAC46